MALRKPPSTRSSLPIISQSPRTGNASNLFGPSIPQTPFLARGTHSVTIYSCFTGIVMRGGAALIEGVHAYNGGRGPALYLAAGSGSHSIRATGNYWDGRGVVVEAPLQHVSITDSLFLQGTGVQLVATETAAEVMGLVVTGNQFQGAGHAPLFPGLVNQANTTLWVNVTGNASFGAVSQTRVAENTIDLGSFHPRATRLHLSLVVHLPATPTPSLDVWVNVSAGGWPSLSDGARGPQLALPLSVAPPRLVQAICNVTMAVPLEYDAMRGAVRVRLLPAGAGDKSLPVDVVALVDADVTQEVTLY